MSALANPLATVDDYFAHDESTPGRHEYYRGYIMAMAGGSYSRGLIITNAAFELRLGLGDRRCDVVATEVRLAADPNAHYTYPDVMVVCGEPAFVPNRPNTLVNPIVILEVLSPSTERADRGRKFGDYRTRESLREYVMVSQFEPKVEVFRRDERGLWTLFEFTGMESIVRLESINVDIPLTGIYRSVKFQPENSLEA